MAYLTAKAHGLEEECQSILEATGVTEDQVNLPSFGEPLSPPRPIVPTHKANWPTKATSQSFFEKALAGQLEGLNLDDEPAAANGFGADEDEADEATGKRAAALDDDDDEDDDMSDLTSGEEVRKPKAANDDDDSEDGELTSLPPIYSNI